MSYKMAKIIVATVLLLCFLTAGTSAGGYGYGGYRAVKVVTQLETTTDTVTETETKTETVVQKLVVTKPCYGGSYKYHG